MERLKTDADLQPLLAQYVPLELKVDDPDFSLWASKFPPNGNGIPMIFIVSATGQEIYNSSGAPAGDGLTRLLEMGIEAAGVPAKAEEKPGEQPAEAGSSHDFVKAVRKASLLALRKKPTMAIEALAPYFDKLEEARASDDRSAKSFVRIVEGLTEDGQAELDDACEKLKTPGQGYFGLLALVRTDRIYGGLPTVADGIKKEMEAIRSDEQKAPYIAHAELIDKGREQEDDGKLPDAIAVYKEVIATYPDTFSAKVCQKKLSQLEGELVASRDDGGGASDEVRKEAAVHLVRAKAYVRYNRPKAREYAQKVIDMVPGTAIARQAEELLRTLPQG